MKAPTDENTEILNCINKFLFHESASSKGQENTDDDKSTEHEFSKNLMSQSETEIIQRQLCTDTNKKSDCEKVVQNTCREVHQSWNHHKNKWLSRMRMLSVNITYF